MAVTTHKSLALEGIASVRAAREMVGRDGAGHVGDRTRRSGKGLSSLLDKSPVVDRSPADLFTLDDVLVDPEDLSLSRGEKSVRLEPKVMSVLIALAERPGSTWRREDLVEKVWPDGGAGDESLTRCIYNLRKGLSRLGSEKALATVSRLGYRLNASVKHVDAAMQLASINIGQTPAPYSIGVLPFADQSAGNDNVWLTRGLMSDLSALLARMPRFQIAPVSSINHHAASDLPLRDLGRELNVRFVVGGSLARKGDDIRIRIELLEVGSGALLWARRYDTQLDRFFEVQDDAVLSISTAISTEVRTPRTPAIDRNKRFNLTAYERVQEAEALRQNYGRETAAQITEKLEEALSLDPDDYAVAAALAVQLSQNVVSGWSADPAATIIRADRLIDEAVTAAPHDADVLTAAGVVAAMFHRPDDAIDFLERSVFINPNDAHAIAVLGWQRCLRDADHSGITLIETAEARAPHHPRFALWATYRATAHLFMLNHQEGLAASKEAARRTPNYFQPLLHCAWAHAGLGDDASALKCVKDAKAFESGVLQKYVDEMRRWAANSRYKDDNYLVLSKLLAVGAAAK